MIELRKPTLDDVADAAGVSTATVSRCLNTPERVSELTRLRVLEIAETLGYTPNFGARALASKRTFTVGAVIPTMENAIFARGLQSFQEALDDKGYTLLVASSGYDTTQEEKQVRSLIARGADGLLLIGAAHLPSTIEVIERARVPFVQAWCTATTEGHFVGFDNAEAASMLARAVIGFGHRHIAMISGITHMNDRAQQRVTGVRAAIRQAGLGPRPLPIVECAYSFAEARFALDTILDAHPQTTAVICGNDVLAVGAIMQAKHRGLRVPEDLSVTGFDDIDIAAIVDPPLTTIHVPHRRMGIAAANVLTALIEGGAAPNTTSIETSLIERKSLGAPAPSRRDRNPSGGP